MGLTEPEGKCAGCGGRCAEGKTLFAADIAAGVLVVRDVPALVCQQCGEEWIGDDAVGWLQALAADARQRGVQLEVVTLSGVA